MGQGREVWTMISGNNRPNPAKNRNPIAAAGLTGGCFETQESRNLIPRNSRSDTQEWLRHDWLTQRQDWLAKAHLQQLREGNVQC